MQKICTLKTIKYYFYSENYNTLMEQSEDNTKRWKNTSCSWLKRNNIVKMTIPSKAHYRFNVQWNFLEN